MHSKKFPFFSYCVNVYTQILGISAVLLFSIGSVCIQKIFIPVEEGMYFSNIN